MYFTPNLLASGPPGPYSWFGTLADHGGGSTGMRYRRNRYFDPVTGQFTQQDPLGTGGGMNLWGFANGDPVNYSDPFGLCPPQICAGLLGAALGAGGRLVFNALADRPLGEGVAASALAGAIAGLTFGAAAPEATAAFFARSAASAATSGGIGVGGGLTSKLVDAVQRSAPSIEARSDAIQQLVKGLDVVRYSDVRDATGQLVQRTISGGTGSNLREIILRVDGSTTIRAFDAARNAWRTASEIRP